MTCNIIELLPMKTTSVYMPERNSDLAVGVLGMKSRPDLRNLELDLYSHNSF